VSSRKESLQHFKKPWAHDHEPVKELVDAVNVRSLSPILSLMHVRTYTLRAKVSNFSHFNVFFSAN
jgi:hypothetical protein